MLARSLLFTIGSVLVAATLVPGVAERYVENTTNVPWGKSSTQRTGGTKEKVRPEASGEAIIRAGPNGHFRAGFLLNGRRVDGLVDTGASTVAINISTAQRIGFPKSRLDFRHQIDTANGITTAAYVKLDSVEIGAIRVNGVDAMVLDDSALSGTLIGMSFLQKLTYRVEDGRMRLTR